MIERVESADDPRLDPFRALPSRGDGGSAFVAESEIVVERLVGEGVPLRGVLVTPSRWERLEGKVGEEVAVWVAEARVIRAVVGFDLHRACVAWGERPEAPRWSVLAERGGVVLVADGVSDPRNVGALARTARVLGAAGLVVGGADPYSRRAIRASMGHVFGLPVWEAGVVEGVGALRCVWPDVRVLAATVGEAATPLPEVASGGRVAVVVGHEGRGVSAEGVGVADGEVTIPQVAGTDSLNVGAAAAVLLYALRG